MVEDRIAALERRASTLEDRVRELESRRAPSWNATRPEVPAASAIASPSGAAVRVGGSVPPPWPAPTPALATGRFDRPENVDVELDEDEAPLPRDLEALFGGRVLAWLGGLAVLAGLAFLLTIAISRGWLGEMERTLLAALISSGLLAVGVRVRERRDPADAALAAAGTGIAGLFGTLVVAGPVYGLVPNSLALFAAYGVGALATFLAARWKAQPFAWLGLLGALWAPVVLGGLDTTGVVFLAIAYASAVGVLVWQRWDALAWAAFATATLQWLAWLYFRDPGTSAMVLMLVTFGALNLKLAFGLEIRKHALSATAVLLVAANALLLAFVGDDVLDSRGWLPALAAAHLAAGLAATRIKRMSRPVALLTLGAGVLIADAAVATLGDGMLVFAIWIASALPFAALLGARPRPEWIATFVNDLRSTFKIGPVADEWPRHVKVAKTANAVIGRGHTDDWTFAALGLVTQLGLAVVHLLALEAPLEAINTPTTPALAAVAVTGLVAFAAARVTDRTWAPLLDALALAALVYFTGLALDGLQLTVALAVEAAALTLVARPAGIAFAGIALTHAMAVLAPPLALVDGLQHPLTAAAGLAAAIAAIAFTTRSKAATALTLLYLASVLTVTAGGEDTGQTLLSVLWAVSGVGALVYGLIEDERGARRGALVLIAVTAAKVFLYDMAELDSLSRVGSFIGFGLLLLAGAFAYQRVRPYSGT